MSLPILMKSGANLTFLFFKNKLLTVTICSALWSALRGFTQAQHFDNTRATKRLPVGQLSDRKLVL